jgi:hypothetical protein
LNLRPINFVSYGVPQTRNVTTLLWRNIELSPPPPSKDSVSSMQEQGKCVCAVTYDIFDVALTDLGTRRLLLFVNIRANTAAITHELPFVAVMKFLLVRKNTHFQLGL